MATGYEDIDNLMTNQNNMFDESLQKQQDIVNQQTQMNIDELERNKAEIDNEVNKTNSGLYTEYQKASNPYGVNAEAMYSRGLGNSGYAETTQTNLYNTYQKNITNTITNAQKLKSDFDFKISQAMQQGQISLAQNALAIYNQKMQLLTQEYELRNNREQYLYKQQQDALSQANWEKEFEYQKQRDALSDNQWQQTFDYNKQRDALSDSQWQQTFDYQKQRDAVADQQWAKEYALSSRKASGSSKSSSSSNNISTYSNSTQSSNGGVSAGANKIYDNLSKMDMNQNMNKTIGRNLIYGEVQNGHISEEEASALFKEFGL